jgi:aarF domain-containing kinase
MRVLQDLKNARTIVQWVAWAEPDYDFGPVMDEWCNEVPKELDFNLEAGNPYFVLVLWTMF